MILSSDVEISQRGYHFKKIDIISKNRRLAAKWCTYKKINRHNFCSKYIQYFIEHTNFNKSSGVTQFKKK